ncbi:hypothetical protein LQV63_30790, partial [Paenibacillus profundus]|nr:hypothetical protein [Paenibacillus profundus]
TSLCTSPRFGIMQNAHVKDGQVYFVDGYGDVYAFNLTTKKLMKKFHLNEYTRQSRLQDEMVYFHKDYLYFFRYNDKTSSHHIEKYNLQGTVESTIILPDLKKKLGNNSVNLYDFKILQP